MDWVVDENALKTGSGANTIYNDFKTNVYPSKLKPTYVKGILDGLTSSYKLLSYFRPHLEDNLNTKLAEPKAPTSTVITINNS